MQPETPIVAVPTADLSPEDQETIKLLSTHAGGQIHVLASSWAKNANLILQAADNLHGQFWLLELKQKKTLQDPTYWDRNRRPKNPAHISNRRWVSRARAVTVGIHVNKQPADNQGGASTSTAAGAPSTSSFSSTSNISVLEHEVIPGRALFIKSCKRGAAELFKAVRALLGTDAELRKKLASKDYLWYPVVEPGAATGIVTLDDAVGFVCDAIIYAVALPEFVEFADGPLFHDWRAKLALTIVDKAAQLAQAKGHVFGVKEVGLVCKDMAEAARVYGKIYLRRLLAIARTLPEHVLPAREYPVYGALRYAPGGLVSQRMDATWRFRGEAVHNLDQFNSAAFKPEGVAASRSNEIFAVLGAGGRIMRMMDAEKEAQELAAFVAKTDALELLNSSQWSVSESKAARKAAEDGRTATVNLQREFLAEMRRRDEIAGARSDAQRRELHQYHCAVVGFNNSVNMLVNRLLPAASSQGLQYHQPPFPNAGAPGYGAQQLPPGYPAPSHSHSPAPQSTAGMAAAAHYGGGPAGYGPPSSSMVGAGSAAGIAPGAGGFTFGSASAFQTPTQQPHPNCSTPASAQCGTLAPGGRMATYSTPVFNLGPAGHPGPLAASGVPAPSGLKLEQRWGSDAGTDGGSVEEEMSDAQGVHQDQQQAAPSATAPAPAPAPPAAPPAATAAMAPPAHGGRSRGPNVQAIIARMNMAPGGAL
uniref:Uncharacterized protein n=1 Tax=Chlamydomonas leiostraca TaxID=1034604 RepID=A0A7S0RSU9_9CHLO|mmetsp:Transcript_30374/g.77495  ORF Transcript_30374/g.77495 Transcript_30374/m.77495 type:complete len:704 (+) Transcript_30374:325-2436(+)|eukprot:CAMPEP_0202879042 /NCGR_PEP_ID=MMETSP1391-20130828/33076_1 /ASSEMBLY_ACC=CAM_ASM_000867 /TAXON_ID=1034604 /ORGANISM="Chlamydomonas leiostraca, Strain SAG 11-49" /LENGTH=703 /DNA_ID=CAMNT_0049561343 /DNA_START=282 /DNA_END=2393 /DNA_ORIENTATION=-